MSVLWMEAGLFPTFPLVAGSLPPAYNPSMGIQLGADLDAWLREGGIVVASSDRAARAIQSEFHRHRRSEGLQTWQTPRIIAWDVFVRDAWEARNDGGLLTLNAAQEKASWASIIRSEQHLPTTLPASVRRLAALAIDAHDLLCSFAPDLLRPSARVAWDQDAGLFSQWLSEFDQYCRSNRVISASRTAVELIRLLSANSSPRIPLCIAGFDRLTPTQSALLNAWGRCEHLEMNGIAEQVNFYEADDTKNELQVCAFWCHRQLEKKSDARLLVITRELAKRRGEIERAFLNFHPVGAKPTFEFSLGVPLSEVPLARSALLLLRWLDASLSENELDWLFSSGLAASSGDSAILQAYMRTLRRLDLQRTRWRLDVFLSHSPDHSPADWKKRMLEARGTLRTMDGLHTPGEWSDKVPRLLDQIGWSGSMPRSTADFQVRRRWQQALDLTASLGFDGRQISWSDFLADLNAAADDVLFAPESTDAPIQIAGPTEAAGLTADAIWFLGAEEDSWPAIGSMHPFLPFHVQRQWSMPHASALQDWEFSKAITNRLLGSAQIVNFSYAKQKDNVQTRPSRLISHMLNIVPQPVPLDLAPPQHDSPLALPTPDASTISFTNHHLRGGASTLSSQSQCPLKAFATVRLGARSWDAAELGLSAKQRGQILHNVLHSIWSGRRPGIKNHEELLAIKNLSEFVLRHVKSVVAATLPAAVREQMPAIYLELEEIRLSRVITAWLEYEKTRVPFDVEQTEAQSTASIAGISMDLRLDRVDRLHDDSHLVIDYKTGNVDPRSWDLPRPDDVQLPLYKLFGLEPLQPSLFENFGGPASGGMVFARIRPGDTCFSGRVADARATINSGLTGISPLVRRKLTAADESAWKKYIEELTNDFIQGRAQINPRDYPETCERCGLYSICRIHEPENRVRFEKGIEVENGEQE